MKLFAPIHLNELLTHIPNAELVNEANPTIGEIIADSRKTHAASLFVAYPEADVNRYLDDAIARGAAAILLDHATIAQFPDLRLPAIVVADVAQATGILASWAMQHPEQRVSLIGVTGTNGKTTTTHMIAAILKGLHRKPAVIGTLGVAYGDVAFETGYTTPPALELYPLLHDMIEADVSTVAMEVSSHALALGRVAGLPFTVGVFTNLSRDHLDFHLTIEAYIEAKSRLFLQASANVINIDDEVGRQYFARFGGTGYSIEARGTWAEIPGDADVLYAEHLMLGSEGSSFDIDGLALHLHVPGRFNVSNALAALGAARVMGISLRDAVVSLALLTSIPGRMERFEGAACAVIVDYAHTPDALERVLQAASEMKPKRLTVVFGCGGGRDAGKRPIMGAIAERYADRRIVTTDNPRFEDPEQIIRDICAGMTTAPEIEPDRARAIEKAIAEAREGELVVVAGKGAETVQIVGAIRTHFDDRVEVQKSLLKRKDAT